MGKLDGKVAIITGAGRGIGRATAILFAKEGAKVVVATRSEMPGREVVDAIRAEGGDALLVVLDISDRDAVCELVKTTVDHFGNLDVVLHNAAHFAIGPIELLDATEVRRTFDVGLLPIFWLTQEALPHLIKSTAARILLTSSLAGNRTNYVGMTPYCSMKAGVNGFIRAAALELARRGITVNGIEPGLTLSHKLVASASAEMIRKMAEPIPIQRAADCDEIARGFLYLASDDAGYVTGQTIVIDGGASLGNPSEMTSILDQL